MDDPDEAQAFADVYDALVRDPDTTTISVTLQEIKDLRAGLLSLASYDAGDVLYEKLQRAYRRLEERSRI